MKKRTLIRTALLASIGLVLVTTACVGPHHGGYRNRGGNESAPRESRTRNFEGGQHRFSGPYDHESKAIYQRHETRKSPARGR